MKNFADGIKTLYQAHGLIEDISETGGILTSDLEIVVNLLSFVLLWKLERFKQAKNYLAIAKKAIDSARKAQKKCWIVLEDVNILTLMAAAALETKNNGNFHQAKKIIKDILE